MNDCTAVKDGGRLRQFPTAACPHFHGTAFDRQETRSFDENILASAEPLIDLTCWVWGMRRVGLIAGGPPMPNQFVSMKVNSHAGPQFMPRF